MPENPEPPKTKRCPFCAEEILAAAVKCKHCQSVLDAASVPQLAGVRPVAEKTEGIGAPSKHPDAPALPAGSVICRACGYCGKGQTIGCLQAFLLVILLCFFIIPGIAYLVYLNYLKGSCPTCGKHDVIPVDSERGRELFAARQQTTPSTPTSAEHTLETPIAGPAVSWRFLIALLAIGGILVAIVVLLSPLHTSNEGPPKTLEEPTRVAESTPSLPSPARESSANGAVASVSDTDPFAKEKAVEADRRRQAMEGERQIREATREYDRAYLTVRGTVKAYEKGVSITVIEADGYERTAKIAPKAAVYDGLAAGDKVIMRIPLGVSVDGKKMTHHVERQQAPMPPSE